MTPWTLRMDTLCPLALPVSTHPSSEGGFSHVWVGFCVLGFVLFALALGRDRFHLSVDPSVHHKIPLSLLPPGLGAPAQPLQHPGPFAGPTPVQPWLCCTGNCHWSQHCPVSPQEPHSLPAPRDAGASSATRAHRSLIFLLRPAPIPAVISPSYCLIYAFFDLFLRLQSRE